ncbi:hypothetical protein NPX13_g2838 [Xylaria arbuscula]|uniref:Uncharacterized protein n=1 Tax=Xylaria arbuscula TaxID=114810 RepID=A0A9W8NIF6_9PEZI|nr:hypothetical protein NPX13_g2838 [Xylaria arbuscula]
MEEDDEKRWMRRNGMHERAHAMSGMGKRIEVEEGIQSNRQPQGMNDGTIHGAPGTAGYRDTVEYDTDTRLQTRTPARSLTTPM